MAVPDGVVHVHVKTGVAPMKFIYKLNDIADDGAVLDMNKDVFFTLTDGRIIFHPRENVICVEIGA